MKKFILIFTLSIFAFSGIKAQLLSESFDYPAGDSIQMSTHTPNWFTIPGVYTNRIFITSPGLDFTGYQMPGIGNAVTLVNTGSDAYTNLSSTVSSGSIYAFCLVRVDSARPTGDYFGAFLPSTSTTNFAARMYVRKAVTRGANIFSFGIIKNALGGGGLTLTDSIYTLGTTYLVIAKHTFVAGAANDQVSMFVYAPGDVIPSLEPSPTITGGPSTTADVPDIGRFALRQGSATISANVVIDEIFVGTDWGTVLPVELSSFTSSTDRNNVNLNWSTAFERNNNGFEIERSSASGQWSKIGFVNGNGTSLASNNYSFTDRGLNSGNYNYRLKQIDLNGNFEYFNLNNEVNIGAPVSFSLSQNYPNPFNPSTTINFDLPYDSKVSLKVYDMSGKEAANLLNENKTAGYYSVNFNASSLSSGIYFYSISAGNFTAVKKMMLVK
jgi:hypothetical protein